MLKTEDASQGNANFSFNSWGDFLLAMPPYTRRQPGHHSDLRFWNTEAYVQDDWKVTPQADCEPRPSLDTLPIAFGCKEYTHNFDPSVYNPALAPVLDNTGSFVSGQAFTPATYTNGLIFPKGAACAAAQASLRRLPALHMAAP